MQISISDRTNALKKIYTRHDVGDIMTSRDVTRYVNVREAANRGLKKKKRNLLVDSNEPKSRYDLVFRQVYTKISNIY